MSSPSTAISGPASIALRAVETLEMAAFASDLENFTRELGDTLILPARVAVQVVNDPTGEPLACAAKALDMPSPVFQRVVMFLNPEFGSSVNNVYRLSRLYDTLSERSALIMLAAWRGATMAVTRAKYKPALYDDERNPARSSPSQTRPADPRRDFTKRNRDHDFFLQLNPHNPLKMLISDERIQGNPRESKFKNQRLSDWSGPLK